MDYVLQVFSLNKILHFQHVSTICANQPTERILLLNHVSRLPQLLQHEVASAMATLTSAPRATPSITLCHALDKSGDMPTATSSIVIAKVSFHSKDADRIRHASRITTNAATRRMAAI